MAREFGKMDIQEVIDRLEAADIANARLNTMQEFWRHPQLAARERWARVGSPAGELDALKPPFNLDGLEPRMDPIPALGEHTRAVLGELGYTAAEIDRLAADARFKASSRPRYLWRAPGRGARARRVRPRPWRGSARRSPPPGTGAPFQPRGQGAAPIGRRGRIPARRPRARGRRTPAPLP